MIKKFSLVFTTVSLILSSNLNAQGICVNEISGADCNNAITTAVPFLRIVPDARSGGMGDIGIATSPDVNAVWQNPSRIAFMENDYGVSISFTPWLRALVNDIYLATLTGYYKLDDQQAAALSLRYFSLGNITFTDINANNIGSKNPNELALAGHYARTLGEKFGVGISLRFIYSNLANNFEVSGVPIKTGIAGAGDVSMFYTTPIEVAEMNSNLNVGLNLSNIGSKITYTEGQKDFIPTNLGLGVGYELDVDDYNEINIYADINKLMVPTPDTTDVSGVDGVFDYRESSSISGMFSSFGDAPGGFSEELREFTFAVGAEYWYNKQFAVRFGYFNEHSTKGNRKFLSAGLGVKYSVFGLDFSYLIPTNAQRSPLDNTLRFTLKFDFAADGAQSN